MPNEKRSKMIDGEAEDLLSRPQEQQEPEKQPLLPGRWIRRVRQSSAKAQDRRRLAEKNSEDHAYLMLGAVPFWAVGATSLQNAVILCAVLIILMLPCSGLHMILRRRLNMAEWLALPATVLVAAPVLLQADSHTAVDNARVFWGRTLRFLRDFCIVMLACGALRELLRHNALLGMPVAMSFKTEAAAQPFFGLILAGLLLAVLRALQALLHRTIRNRKLAEAAGEEAGA